MGNIRDQIIPFLLLLQTTERHLGAWNILLGVLKILEQGALIPNNALLLVGIGILETCNLTGLTAKEAKEIGADFVSAALLKSMALLATGLEEVCTLSVVSCQWPLC